MSHFAYWIAGWIFFVGLYGIVTSRHWIHLCLCLGVIQTSTYVLLASIGYRSGAAAPVFADHPAGTPAVDPVVQALMLTDIVVEATMIALLLSLVIQIHKKYQELDPNALTRLRG